MITPMKSNYLYSTFGKTLQSWHLGLRTAIQQLLLQTPRYLDNYFPKSNISEILLTPYF